MAAIPAANQNEMHSARSRALVVPREHGAWGMMLVPLLAAAAVGLLEGGNPLPAVLLTLLAICLFCLRTPLESWMGSGPMRAQTKAERQLVMKAVFGMSMLALALVTLLMLNSKPAVLAGLGAIAAGAFGIQVLLKRAGRRGRMPAQVAGALGLTAVAPAAYYVVTGQFNRQALALWVANWLFAGEQIHYVQMRIHGARLEGWRQKTAHGALFLAGHLALLAVLAAAWHYRMLPALAALAFLPVILRGLAWFVERQEPLAVRRLGWTEMAHALVFGVLLAAGFHLGF